MSSCKDVCMKNVVCEWEFIMAVICDKTLFSVICDWPFIKVCDLWLLVLILCDLWTEPPLAHPTHQKTYFTKEMCKSENLGVKMTKQHWRFRMPIQGTRTLSVRKLEPWSFLYIGSHTIYNDCSAGQYCEPYCVTFLGLVTLNTNNSDIAFSSLFHK